MTIKLNILDVMSKDNVHQTIEKALAEGELSIIAKILDYDDEELVFDHCLLVEWLVNSNKLAGAQGVLIKGMEIYFACEITKEGGDTIVSIGEVLEPDFYLSEDDVQTESAAVLIPDASFYGFSTESLKPTLNQLLSSMFATAEKKPLIRFTNNPRIHDEKIKLSKDTLLAVHDLLKGTYDDNADISTSLVNLKADLVTHKRITVPDNYYVDEALKNEIYMYSASLND